MMTERRKKRVQTHTIPVVRQAIMDSVFGAENQTIFTMLFIQCRTYEEVAEMMHIEPRSLYARVKRLFPAFEKHLQEISAR